jgi:hypothetical protein
MEANVGPSAPPQRFYASTARPRPTTPPKRIQPPTNQDRPIHNKLTSNVPYSSLGEDYIETAFVQADEELRGKWVVTSPEEFLTAHLPDDPPNMPEVDGAMFQRVGLKKKEKNMYHPLVRWNLASCSPF